jgi:hypothetical protein
MRKRLGLALALGLVLAVFVSACGAAFGPVTLTAGGQFITAPVLVGLHLPAIQRPAVVNSARELQRFQSSAAQGLFENGIISCHGLH